MKWKVIGWTYYEDIDYEEGDATDAVTYAIIDEIKKKGYVFSGWDHQEGFNTVPVLNDGKKRTFSQRTFGNLMAIAHGYTGRFDYSLFTFGMDSEHCVYPDSSFDESAIVSEEELNEEFTIDYNIVSFITDEGVNKIKIPNLDILRYIDRGDTLILKKDDELLKYKVTFAIREKDISKKELRELETDLYILDRDSKEYKEAEEKYQSLEKVIMIEYKDLSIDK